MSWIRNPDLLARGKFDALARRYGSKVIYLRGYMCPKSGPHVPSEQKCPANVGDGTLAACAKCGMITNNFSRIYDEPKVVQHSHRLYRNSPNPAYPERLEHRWLLTPPVVTDKAGVTYEYDSDFTLDGRNVIWNARAPRLGAEYTISYSAYAEDSVQLIHASMGQIGGPTLAEQSTLLPTVMMDQGSIGISIPPEASCFQFQLGDLFVIADSIQRSSQVVDVTLPRRRTYNRWIIAIDKAFYRRKREDGNLELVDITSRVSYDFEAQEWVFTDLPAGVREITMDYTHANVYTANLDRGEGRNPYWSDQSTLAILKKIEVSV